eukprot:356996-Amphidinium_carterae.1
MLEPQHPRTSRSRHLCLPCKCTVQLQNLMMHGMPPLEPPRTTTSVRSKIACSKSSSESAMRAFSTKLNAMAKATLALLRGATVASRLARREL